MPKRLHMLPVLFAMIMSASSMTAAPLRAAGPDPPDQVQHTDKMLCEALHSIILYFDRNQEDILTQANEEIAESTFQEAITIFEREDLHDASVEALIEDVETLRRQDFRGKLEDTGERLSAMHRDGCLKLRSSMHGARDARDVLSRPGFELASVRRDVQDLGQYAPIEFRTPVFRCVGDFEMCKATLSDELGCGITFMICVGQQLIPFVSK